MTSSSDDDSEYNDTEAYGPAYLSQVEYDVMDIKKYLDYDAPNFLKPITKKQYLRSRITYSWYQKLSMNQSGTPNQLSSTDDKHSYFHSVFIPKHSANNPHNKTIKINDVDKVTPYDMRELFKDDIKEAQDKIHDITVDSYKYSPLILGGMDKVDSTLSNRRPIDVIKEYKGELYKWASWVHTLGLGCNSLILSLDKDD